MVASDLWTESGGDVVESIWRSDQGGWGMKQLVLKEERSLEVKEACEDDVAGADLKRRYLSVGNRYAQKRNRKKVASVVAVALRRCCCA